METLVSERAAAFRAVRGPFSPLVSLRGISKSFSGVPVLRTVDFDVFPGEMHVLAGENGAGKSTLMNILAGVHPDYAGEIILRGRLARLRSTADARRRGIAMIHQEMSLVPTLSVAENLWLGGAAGRHPVWVNPRAQLRAAKEPLARVGLDVDPGALVGDLPVAARQMIEIARALAGDADILIMDEPTSALNEPEVRRLFELIRNLAALGKGIVYITHKMEEIYQVAQRITVLRDGRLVGAADVEKLPPEELVRWMVGRELGALVPARANTPGPARLAVENLQVRDPAGGPRAAVAGVSFFVRAGEVLGLAGLEGSGNHELLRALFGAYGPPSAHRLTIDRRPYAPRNPRQALAAGVALLTSDRKTDGLVLDLSIAQNVTLASLPRFSPGGWIQSHREDQTAAGYVRTFDIRCAGVGQRVAELSGGNQQKVALARWIETQPRVLLLDEPTRGVDVGAKQEIYQMIRRWTETGVAILLITSEMPELLALADRILVLHRGQVTAELERAAATQENVLRAAMGEVG